MMIHEIRDKGNQQSTPDYRAKTPQLYYSLYKNTKQLSAKTPTILLGEFNAFRRVSSPLYIG